MMNRSVLFSVFILVAAIAGAAQPTRALCIDNDTLSLNRETSPEENTFVNSSPASADSNFRLEVNLNNGLDIFETETDDTATPTEEDARGSEVAEESETIVDESTVSSLEADSTEVDSSAAADLETVDLEAQTPLSRADYLNSRANEINQCQ